jgi:hypothetical protein
MSTVPQLQNFLFRYCIPTDNDRPLLDIKHIDDICLDKNGTYKTPLYELRLTWRIVQVPVIAVFTKYDQFKREIKMKLEDQNRDPAHYDDDVENIFNEQFLGKLKGSPPFVRLESKNVVTI